MDISYVVEGIVPVKFSLKDDLNIIRVDKIE